MRPATHCLSQHQQQINEGETSGIKGANNKPSNPGCLEGRGYDESGTHGFVLIDIDEAAFTMKREFVPFAKRGVYVTNVDVTGCMSPTEMIERIKCEIGGRDLKSDLVKIVLTGDLDIDCEKNLNLISQYFDGRFYCHKVSDSTGTLIDPAEYENDMSLKGEFIRLSQKINDMTEEDRMAVIRCGLQVLRGEAIDV